LFYPANDNKPLFVTVLHKKHPKSFVSNFWGAVHFETASFYFSYAVQLFSNDLICQIIILI